MKKQDVAAIYARVSSQKQKEGETIDSQVAALQSLATERGYLVPDSFLFTDNGVSGSLLQRPGLDELRDVIRSEPISAILVYSPDRLSRNFAHQLMLLEEFKRQSVHVIFVKGPSDSENPESRMLSYMQGIFAEYERTLILDRSRRGRYHKAKMNDACILPRIPYGYDRLRTGSKTEVVVVESEANIVKEIFLLYISQGLPIHQISEKLTKKGVLTPKGHSKWHDATVRNILRNQAYIGTAHYGRTERCEGTSNKIRHYRSGVVRKAQHARRVKPEQEWIPISMPQIISESDFEIAQFKLKANAIHASRNTVRPGLLQGLVICGECGKPYYKTSRRYKNKIYGVYHCSRRGAEDGGRQCHNPSVNQEELDKLAFDEVLKLLETPELIYAEFERRAKERSSYEDLQKRDVLNAKELARISHARDRLLDAYQSELISLEELRSRNASIDVRRRELDKEARTIEAQKLATTDQQFLQEDFKLILDRVNSAADSLSFHDQQRLVRLLVEQVVINRDEVVVTHCISPRAIANESGQLRSDGRG